MAHEQRSPRWKSCACLTQPSTPTSSCCRLSPSLYCSTWLPLFSTVIITAVTKCLRLTRNTNMGCNKLLSHLTAFLMRAFCSSRYPRYPRYLWQFKIFKTTCRTVLDVCLNDKHSTKKHKSNCPFLPMYHGRDAKTEFWILLNFTLKSVSSAAVSMKTTGRLSIMCPPTADDKSAVRSFLTSPDSQEK